jgi:hypothetical protein
VTFSPSSKTRHTSCCPCRIRPAPRREALRIASPGSDSSLGVLQRLPLRRHTTRASTPRVDRVRASTFLLASFGQELPPPDSFRPCRSSRLRRFSPLERCRLVSSCSRPWGSPRFRPVPSSRGGGGSDIRRCLLPVLPGWSAASACFRLCASEDAHRGAAQLARSFPWLVYPSKVFPRAQPWSVGPAIDLPVHFSGTPPF